ncbi:hypothetical protein DMW15_22600 [Vibrio parahaemolyticus]|nr:hypothetical protein [Vibrio parahaemolyticus]
MKREPSVVQPRFVVVLIISLCLILNGGVLVDHLSSLVPIGEPLYSILKLSTGIFGMLLFMMFAQPKQKKSGS